MTAMYRPGELYVGREGDTLFAVYAGGGVEFVTVRGTRLTVEHVERVYAPLTLARDAEMEQLRAELADVHHDLTLCVGDGYSTAASAAVEACRRVAAAEAERDRLAAQIARVRQLHRQVCSGACGLPDGCECADNLTVCDTCHEMWPCPTISALDEEADRG